MLDSTIPVSLEGIPYFIGPPALENSTVREIEIKSYFKTYFDSAGFGVHFYGLVDYGDRYALVTEAVDFDASLIVIDEDMSVSGGADAIPALDHSVLDTVDAFMAFLSAQNIVVMCGTARVSADRIVFGTDFDGSMYYFSGNYRTVAGAAWDSLRALIASKVVP